MERSQRWNGTNNGTKKAHPIHSMLFFVRVLSSFFVGSLFFALCSWFNMRQLCLCHVLAHQLRRVALVDASNNRHSVFASSCVWPGAGTRLAQSGPGAAAPESFVTPHCEKQHTSCPSLCRSHAKGRSDVNWRSGRTTRVCVRRRDAPRRLGYVRLVHIFRFLIAGRQSCVRHCVSP